MNRYHIAVIPGDGVGKAVVPEGIRAIRAAGEVTGRYTVETTEYPWSCAWYLEHGEMMPADGIDRLRDSHAIYLGAVGFPGVPDHVSLWGLLRRSGSTSTSSSTSVQSACSRGAKGPPRPRAWRHRLHLHSNSEDEYSGLGGRTRAGTPDEVVIQTSLFTRRGTERIISNRHRDASDKIVSTSSWKAIDKCKRVAISFEIGRSGKPATSPDGVAKAHHTASIPIVAWDVKRTLAVCLPSKAR